MEAYHDLEWGVPAHDDQRHFEFLVLEGFQAGLSWRTILHKREGFRRAFSGFDPVKVARFRRDRIERLLTNESIVRNRQKVEATVTNARAFLKVQKEFGSFDTFVWGLAEPRSSRTYRRLSQIPAKTRVSEQMSKSLLAFGFRFVGPTICYAYMQATGMVNDHLRTCPRYERVERLQRKGALS